MEKQQAKTTKLLADLNDQLGVLSKELGELDANFKAKNEELTGLQTQAALMEKRLAAASKLITGLTGERTRWTSDIGDLNNSKVQLVGDCLLAASFLSYAGAFTSDFRAGMIYETFAKKVCRGVLGPFCCFYAIDATRLRQTRPFRITRSPRGVLDATGTPSTPSRQREGAWSRRRRARTMCHAGCARPTAASSSSTLAS